MADEWQVRKLAELCESVDYGYTASAKEQPVGPKFLRITDIVAGSIDWDSVPYCEISGRDADKYRLHDGDIVIARTGATTGYSAHISNPPDSVFASYLVRLRLRPEAEPRFVAYFLKSPRFWDFMRGVLGDKSAQPNASASTMTQVSLALPPLCEQRAIACILGTLDDKIELNRRMNQTLEEMAQAIFRSWFVDFDPVRAKAAGQQPGGLSPEIAALFPDSFEESEMGAVPRGWRVMELSEVLAKVTKGTTPTQSDVSSAPVSDMQVTYIKANSIDDDGSILYDRLSTVPKTVHEGPLRRSILQANDVLYTIAGTIGRASIVGEDVLPANTNQAVAILRPDPNVPPYFVFLTMRQEAFRNRLHSNVVHAVQANLSLGVISKAKAVFPPVDSLGKMFRPVEQIMRKVEASRRESRILAEVRNTLLPKLVSGELAVADAERIVGRCG